MALGDAAGGGARDRLRLNVSSAPWRGKRASVRLNISAPRRATEGLVALFSFRPGVTDNRRPTPPIRRARVGFAALIKRPCPTRRGGRRAAAKYRHCRGRECSGKPSASLMRTFQSRRRVEGFSAAGNGAGGHRRVGGGGPVRRLAT